MNVVKALEENLEADLSEAETDAQLALGRYVAAQQRISELRAVLDLRRAMGAAVAVSGSQHRPTDLSTGALRGAA